MATAAPSKRFSRYVLRPQCIELSAVCNSKIEIGIDSVNLSGFCSRSICAQMGRTNLRGTRCMAEQSRCHGQPTRCVSFCGYRGASEDEGEPSPRLQVFARDRFQGALRSVADSDGRGLSATFLLERAASFRIARRHLTILGAAGAEVRLTCLSFRCLSSYLIFSASSSDQQAAGRFAGAQARPGLTVCAVSSLTTDLSEKDLSDKRSKNTDLTASEERVNVDRRWWGTSAGRVRVLAAGLVLLGAGCAVLGWDSHSRKTAANVAANVPAIEKQTPTMASVWAAQEPGLPGGRPRRPTVPGTDSFCRVALIFEPNQGQGNLDPADPRAKFVTRGSGYSLFLGSEGAILSLVSQVDRRHSAQHAASPTRVNSLQMKLAGANPTANLAGADQLPGRSNYFMGNDPAKWRNGVPQFARVRYEDVYPGINLVFYGNQGRLEYDFQVAPGSDPAQAELEFKGAKRLELKDGALVIKSESGACSSTLPACTRRSLGGSKRWMAASFCAEPIAPDSRSDAMTTRANSSSTRS